MSVVNDKSDVWMISSSDGSFRKSPGFPCRLKPVIRLYKSALTDIDPEESNEPKQDVIDNNGNNNEKKEYVAVPNTLQKISIVFTMIGIIIISISIFIIIVKKAKRSTK